jgi:tetratricopeptide (TPR) repeat protein
MMIIKKRNRIEMRKKLYFVIFPVIILMFSASCNRKTIISTVPGKGGLKYDDAEFNYLYVEAVKQKLFGNGGDALKYFEQCIVLNPSSDAAYFQMAQIMVAQNDLNNGKKYSLKALSIDDKNLWYLMMLGGIYYQEKNIDSALIYYEKAVKYFPENASLLLTLGNLYSEHKDYEKAAELFDSFDVKYGINEASTISAVKSLMEEGKYDSALIKAKLLILKYPEEINYNGLLADIYRAKGDTTNAMEVYINLIEKNPDNAQVQLSLCDFLLSQKRYTELFILINKVILNSNVTREDKISLMAKMLEMSDLVDEEANNFGVSLMILEANYKSDDVVPLLRPELLIKENKLADAAARLEEIIKTNPENYYAWEKLLLVYLQLKDYNNLLLKGEECATQFNMSFLAKILYANAAIETRKFDIAVEELRKAEILAGSNSEYMIQVLTMRADVYYRMKDYTKAFEEFDKALGYNRDDLTVLNNYAYFLAEQNIRLKEAEEMAKKVIDTDKTNTTFLDTYAWVLYKRGKVKEAARIMEAIIGSREEADAEWYEHYGYILKKQRKCGEAVKNWNIALEIDKSKNYLKQEIENCGN